MADGTDRAARTYDPRVFQVQATYADSVREVLVATSEGRLSFDRQPMARMSVTVLAREGDAAPQSGHSGGGKDPSLCLIRHNA